MDASARTGAKGEGCVDDKVLIAYGRDTLNEQRTASAGILSKTTTCALVNKFFRAPKLRISCPFQCLSRGRGLYRLDFILTRKPHRPLVRNVTVRRPALVKPESDQALGTADIRLLGRFSPNRRKLEIKGRRANALQQPMTNPQLRRAFTGRFIPLPPGTDVDGMAVAFAEAMLSTAANIAPREKCSQGPAGWYASKEKKAEMLAAWQERETAREVLGADPNCSSLRKSLKSAGKRLNLVRIEAVQRFFETFVSQLEARIKEGDLSCFFEHP